VMTMITITDRIIKLIIKPALIGVIGFFKMENIYTGIFKISFFVKVGFTL
jgi:hypothetical protein